MKDSINLNVALGGSLSWDSNAITKGLTIGFGCALLCLGCNTYEQAIPKPVEDDMPSYQAFVSDHSFPYIAPPDRQTHLQQKYSALSVGLTKQEVTKMLGAPDCSEPSYTKTSSPGYVGSVWTYYLEKPHPTLANTVKDKAVHVFFDIEGYTEWIVSNIQGLDEIGGLQ